MTTLYIAGPMAGQPDMNWDMFNEAEIAINAHGIDAVNPHHLNFSSKEQMLNNHRFRTPCFYLKRDVENLLKCDGIVLLPGWEDSSGASFEVFIARRLEFPVYIYSHETRTFYKEDK